MRTVLWLLGGLGVGVVVVACGASGATAPSAPQSGGDIVNVLPPSDNDAGSEEDGGPSPDSGTKPDAGSSSGSTYACESVQPLQSSGGDTPDLTSTDAPLDFVITRQAIRWNTDCTHPVLTIQLSDGSCPNGFGHELDIALSVNDIEDGLVHLGNNELSADTDLPPISVRYTRPKRLLPNGTWGTCADVDGQLVFLEAPEIATDNFLWARFQFALTPCDGSMNDPINVFGAVKIMLRTDLSRLCPDRAR